MDQEKFLNLSRQAQNGVLIKMAQNALIVLSDFPTAYRVTESSLKLARRYLEGEKIPASQMACILDSEDMNRGLGMQIYNVDDDVNAIAALDIACYAIGSVSNTAFEEQGIVNLMPDPVSESRPEVIVDALVQYQKLFKRNLVPELL